MLTPWKARMGGQVSTRKTNQASELHSRPAERRGKNKLAHGSKQSDRRVLTNWKMRKETSQDTEITERVRVTHFLEGAVGRAKSAQRTKQRKQGALTNWRAQRKGQVNRGTRKKSQASKGHSPSEQCRWETSQDTETN